jgi:enoyl-CoA hydratase/carnithine racemase
VVELDHLRYRTEGAVAVITLDRPQVRNALAPGPTGTRAQLLHALDLAAADDTVGAVLLDATGDAFCAGADLSAAVPRADALADLDFVAAAEDFHHRVRQTPLPVVASVRGFCLGAGLLLATCADLVIAGPTARFGLPEGRLGLIGATQLVPIVGRQWAKFLIMTGEPISAARAEAIGLVLAVVPDDQLDARALDLAGRLSRMPKEGLGLNKRAVDAVADAAGDEAGRKTALAHDALTLSLAARATAPDGRSFRQILEVEGMRGLKAARDAQYADPWLDAEPGSGASLS